MSSTSVTLPFNLTLGEESATWMYTPLRDSNVTQGWNSSYTGSTVWSGGAGIGQAFRRTQKDEAGLWLEWEGTALYLCVSALNGAGYNFMVDGQPVHKLGSGHDAACSSFLHDPNHGPETLIIVDGLEYGTHTAKLNATMPNSQSLFEFYGGVVTLGAQASSGASIVSTPVTIDDRDPRWVYAPAKSWLQDGDPQNINGTHTYTCDYNQDASASFTFNGTSVVQVIGIEQFNTFGYTVQLTNHNTGVYNGSNSWRTEDQTMYIADNLDPSSSYTITITNFNPNLPSGVPNIQNCFNLDALLLYQPTGSGSSTSTSSSASSAPTNPPSNPTGGNAQAGTAGNSSSGLSSTAITGIAVGCAALVVIVLALLLFIFCRRRRHRSAVDFRSVDLVGGGSSIHTPPMETIGGIVPPSMPEPTPYVMPPPAAARSHTTTTSTSGPWRSEKSMRQLAHAPSASGSQLLPRSPGAASSSHVVPSSPSAATTVVSTVTPEMLEGAATADLVTALNSRLQTRNTDFVVEEPPMYEHGP